MDDPNMANLSDINSLRPWSEEFATTHVRELAEEMLEWSSTAILRDGKLRELAAAWSDFDPYFSLSVAKSYATQAAIAAVAATQRVPETHRLVPLEPTVEMLRAAAVEWLLYGTEQARYPLAQNFEHLDKGWQIELSRATHVYRAMLAAAPPAPAAEPDEMAGRREKVLSDKSPGSEWHLSKLMAPYHLNFVVGQDREQLLAWGRDVWDAARADLARKGG